jgi:hypothetical protein
MSEARRLGRYGVWRSASLVTPELADHVCLQLVTEEGADPLPSYRALAPALGLS